jgi:hypothetical protein
LVFAENSDLQRGLPVGHLGSVFNSAHITALVDSIARCDERLGSGGGETLGSTLLQRKTVTADHFHSLDAVPDLTERLAWMHWMHREPGCPLRRMTNFAEIFENQLMRE